MLPHIIGETSEIRVHQDGDGGRETHVVTICNASMQRPTTYDYDGIERPLDPHLARLRGLTYAGAVLVDVAHDIYEEGTHVERRLFREVCLCRLPVMLGSSCCHLSHQENVHECRLDQGGYFIVAGCEKVLVAQLFSNDVQFLPLQMIARDWLNESSLTPMLMRSLIVHLGDDRSTVGPRSGCQKQTSRAHDPVGERLLLRVRKDI